MMGVDDSICSLAFVMINTPSSGIAFRLDSMNSELEVLHIGQ